MPPATGHPQIHFLMWRAQPRTPAPCPARHLRGSQLPSRLFLPAPAGSCPTRQLERCVHIAWVGEPALQRGMGSPGLTGGCLWIPHGFPLRQVCSHSPSLPEPVPGLSARGQSLAGWAAPGLTCICRELCLASPHPAPSQGEPGGPRCHNTPLQLLPSIWS